LDRIANRSPKYTLPKVPRWFPLKKSDEPDAGTYTSAVQPISRSFKLAKSKNLNFIDELLKRKKNVPGPIYDIAKADRVLSNGVGKSYK
jgi:hypothetical protein